MKIGDREIGPGRPCWIVAELGINHNGSTETALAMVRAAKEAGADAVKIQLFRAEHFCTERAVWKGESQLEMFRRYELGREAVFAIAAECQRVGVTFFGTPDCVDCARLLLEAGAPVLKVGSDDLTNTPLIRDLASLGVPLILSTGMGTWQEIADATEAAFDGCPHELYCLGDVAILLHCVSRYPTPPDGARLSRIASLAEDTPYRVGGYSDHTDGTDAAPLAVALGACVIEKHFTLDRSASGPDHAFSADLAMFAEMVRKIRLAEVLLGSGANEPSDAEKAMRPVARRSIVAARDLEAGTVLGPERLAYKRPGDGLMPYEADRVLGKRLRVAVPRDALILESMVV